MGCHDRDLGSIWEPMFNTRQQTWKNKFTLAPRSTHSKKGTREKRPGKEKATGLVLTILAIDCRLIYKISILLPKADTLKGVKKSLKVYFI